ncbi:MAG: methyltransferase domain-containing protein [Candidatus Polarisedimenticolaceae bacterium]|nr:methyltransferase domain-containing protein [Candidatus Polarisedimenticolaceae bacterium]
MTDLLGFLRCPRTKSHLVAKGDGFLYSMQGGYRYPIVHGVPDLRLFDPPYTTREEELRIVNAMAEVAGDVAYESLMTFYANELAQYRDPERIQNDIRHRLALLERSPSRLVHLFEKACVSKLPAGSVALDLGCGSGEAIGALIEHGAKQVIGIDISLIELVLAKKLLSEQGVAALLVAGCAEAMPFSDEVFDFIYSPDVIEHVSDQSIYLQEACRILHKEGRMLLNSPNRYSLFTFEPHVGIWGLTFLPRPWIDPVCRMLGRGPYVGKRLVSLPELRRLIKGSFVLFDIFARNSNPKSSSIVGRIYHALSPISVSVYAYIADQHVVLVRK